jgi:hypothetical protein
MNEEQKREIVSAYPSGKSVTVYFDPHDATSAVLEPGSTGKSAQGLGYCRFFFY